jgi:hypothetical protein
MFFHILSQLCCYYCALTSTYQEQVKISIPENIFRSLFKYKYQPSISLFPNPRHLCSMDGSTIEDTLANRNLAAKETRASFKLLPSLPCLQYQSHKDSSTILFQFLPGPC